MTCLIFELKKLRKRRVYGWLFLIAVLFSLYANFVLIKEQAGRQPDYPFHEDIDPYLKVSLEVSQRITPVINDTETDPPLEREFLDRWASISNKKEAVYRLSLEYQEQQGDNNSSSRPNLSYPENLSSYERMYYELYRDLYSLLQDYADDHDYLRLNDRSKRDLEWIFHSYEASYEASHEVSHETGHETHRIPDKHTNPYSGPHLIGANPLHYNANLVQRFLFQSRFTLGLPFFILFILLFIGIYSGEREQGTLDFLRLQPASKYRTLIAKLITMVISAGIYLIFLILCFILIAILIGLPIDDLAELYRVYPDSPLQAASGTTLASGVAGTAGATSTASVAGTTGASLLLRLILSFFLLSFFFSTLILFISTRSPKTVTAMAAMILIMMLNYTLMENIPSLQTPYHPIYQMDFLKVLIGKVEHRGTMTGEVTTVVHPAAGVKAYLLLLLPSLILVTASLLPIRESSNAIITTQKPTRSFLAFECKKISKAQSFGFYIIGAIFLMAILFINPLTKDTYHHQRELRSHLEVDRAKQTYERAREIYRSLPLSEEEIDQTIDDATRSTLEVYEAQLAKYEAFLSRDGPTYYQSP